MQFLIQNGAMILGVLFGVSEALSLIPQVKSNGVFQMIYNLLKSLMDATKKPQA